MVLVDTGPLVALCDGRDSKHRTAVKDLDSFAPRGLAVCEAVLTEACFHLPHRQQRLRLHGLLTALNAGPVPGEGQADVRLDAFAWLVKYSDHQPDWADAWLAVLSGRHKGSAVWTYDREFRSIWRLMDGTPIPLAVR